MNVHLEIYSHDRTEAVMSLLRLPPSLVQPYKPRMSVIERNGWQIAKHNSIKIDDYINSAEQTKHNSITLTSRTRPVLKTSLPHRLVRAYQDMRVSPTNSLWFPAAAWPAAKITENHRTFFGQRGLEYALKESDVAAYPTYVSTHLRYDTTGGAADFEEWFFRSIVEGMNNGALKYADYVGASFDPDPETTRHSGAGGSVDFDLSGWPKAFCMLGEFVDGLHPIMVASLNTCQALRGLLGDSLELCELQSRPGAERGVLRVPESIVLEHQRSSLIGLWLVPRDETTAYRRWWGESKGEFIIARQPCYTLRRYKELLSADKIPSPPFPGSPVVSLLVQARYCEMIRIDPEDMLLVWRYEATQRECQAQIDAYFTALPDFIPVRERVWEAHKAVWEGQHNFGEFIAFAAKRYFAPEQAP